MKVGVLDVGSNSVRLMLWADGKTLYKRMQTTRLGEGLNLTGAMKPEAIERTVAAMKAFKAEAEREGAQNVYAFATAAVRSSENASEFLDAAYKGCGIKVQVLSGEEEAAAGLCGAIGSGDGGIIDVGGASTEVTVRRGGEIVFSTSLNIGTVRILDAAGRDFKKMQSFIAPALAPLQGCDFSGVNMYSVGGTSTRLASIKHGLKIYTPEISNGTAMSRGEIFNMAVMLTAMDVEKIRATTVCTRSADLIGGGALLLCSVMEKLNVPFVIASESDNLEGFVQIKLKGGAA